MKAVLLLSSGIDSPVAGYMMAKKGIDIEALYMDSSPHQDIREVDKVVSLVKRLSLATKKQIPGFKASNARFQTDVRANTETKYACLLCKRFMYRVAQEFAKKRGANAIITGESLGQVASQTLENMVVLDEAVDMRVFRPLIGLDKEETIEVARRIGTIEISEIQYGGCRFAPKGPSTGAKIQKILEQESKVDIKAHVGEAIKSIQAI